MFKMFNNTNLYNYFIHISLQENNRKLNFFPTKREEMISHLMGSESGSFLHFLVESSSNLLMSLSFFTGNGIAAGFWDHNTNLFYAKHLLDQLCHNRNNRFKSRIPESILVVGSVGHKTVKIFSSINCWIIMKYFLKGFHNLNFFGMVLEKYPIIDYVSTDRKTQNIDDQGNQSISL